MFAVIKTGGKQYKVANDDIIKVEKLAGEAGDSVRFDQVLMVATKEDGSDAKVGAPFLDGAAVSAEVLEQTRGDKIVIFKKKRRHTYRRKKGHRQDLTTIRILDVTGKGGKKPAAKKAAPKKETKAASTAATPKKLDAPQGEADDLSKISGVGPALVKKLNDGGIFHFWQIAEWSADDIAWFDENLQFKGRIERDDWMSQAKTLAAESK